MSKEGNVVGNLTNNDGPLSLRGSIAPGHWQLKLLINARVYVQPDALRDAVEKALKDVAGDRVVATITNVRNFFPGGSSPRTQSHLYLCPTFRNSLCGVRPGRRQQSAEENQGDAT